MRHTMTSFRSWASALALLMLSFGATSFASAPADGSSASGTYQFSLEDGYTKYVEFDARSQADGTATGQMTITDEAPIPNQDVDGTGDPALRGSETGFSLTVQFDGLSVERNVAVMSGTVRDSSDSSLVGRRVLLIVEDNGENSETPDRLAWGLYDGTKHDWEVGDAELREDPGVGMSWIATDEERREDQGIAMPGNASITVQSFPLEAYSFFSASRGAGDIRVQQ